MLKQIRDPRDQRYIAYQTKILLMARILSSIVYISSIRKISGEFHSETVIENIGYLSGQERNESPYLETINNYLKEVRPEELQDIICELVKNDSSRYLKRSGCVGILAGHDRRGAVV